jgi:hypothetical protein
VGIIGYAMMSPPLPYHDYLKADTFFAFRVALERGLAFPWVQTPRLAALTWLPLIALAATMGLKRFRTIFFERYLLGLGAWVAVQSAAIAYSRGANGAVPASRYLDLLSLGFVANTMAVIAIVVSLRRPPWMRTAGWVVVTLWVGAGAVGINQLSDHVLSTDGQERRQWMRTYVRNVREFVITDNLAPWLHKTGPREIPYYSAGMLAGFLREPEIRRILPATLRAPLTVSAKTGTTPTFARSTVTTDVVGGWDSYAVGGAAAQGRFESGTLSCTDFHRLRFETTGSPGAPGLRLVLRETGSGRETPIAPPIGSGSGWRSVHVACPPAPFVIVAEDTSATSSFGFRPPTEIAWGSAVAETLIQRASWITALAAAVALAAIAMTIGQALGHCHSQPAPVAA